MSKSFVDLRKNK